MGKAMTREQRGMELTRYKLTGVSCLVEGLSAAIEGKDRIPEDFPAALNVIRQEIGMCACTLELALKGRA